MTCPESGCNHPEGECLGACVGWLQKSVEAAPAPKHSHYFKDVRHLSEIDVYRVIDLFQVSNPCAQHAVKKLLCAGQRGAKDQRKDFEEAIDSLRRGLAMMDEDSALHGVAP